MAPFTLGFVYVIKGEGGGGDGALETQYEPFRDWIYRVQPKVSP